MYRIRKINLKTYMRYMFIIGMPISGVLYSYLILRTGGDEDIAVAGMLWVLEFNLIWNLVHITFVRAYNLLAKNDGGFIVDVEAILPWEYIEDQRNDEEVIDSFTQDLQRNSRIELQIEEADFEDQ